MNQRDQNQRNNPQGRGGRYGSMPRGSREHEEGRGRQPRFTDTYNPEPQWLREDTGERMYGQGLGGSGYDRDDEEFRGGRYGNPARGYGQSSSQYGAQRGAQYERYEPHERDRYQNEQAYAEGRGMQGRGMREPYEPGYRGGDYQGDFERGGRASGMRSEYGGYSYGQGEGGREYGAPRRGMQSGWQERSGSQFASDYGSGGYDQVSGYGERGYGSSGRFSTGNYQSGMEGQRSYRGLGPQTYKRSDDRIRDDVCERLTDSERIDASNVTIDVNQGAVTLSGTVPERHMRYAAEDLVDDALGVESINNQLRVQSASTGQSTTTGVGGRTGGALSEKQTH